MTIRETLPIWDAELSRLSLREMNLRFGVVLHALEHDGAAAADAACRVYAETGEWPPLPDAVRLEVMLRLCCLRWYCTVVPDAHLEEDPATFAEGVLIDYWRAEGRLDWVLEGLLHIPQHSHPQISWAPQTGAGMMPPTMPTLVQSQAA